MTCHYICLLGTNKIKFRKVYARNMRNYVSNWSKLVLKCKLFWQKKHFYQKMIKMF